MPNFYLKISIRTLSLMRVLFLTPTSHLCSKTIFHFTPFQASLCPSDQEMKIIYISKHISTMPLISGKSILIIGGSSGMGFSVAKLALAEKVRVAIASSSETRVNDAVARLKAAFPKGSVTGFTIDLDAPRLEPRLKDLFERANAEGPLDHLILTAGRGQPKPVAEIDEAYIASVSAQRVVAPMLIAKLAPTYLRKGYSSSIIYTSGQVADKSVLDQRRLRCGGSIERLLDKM